MGRVRKSSSMLRYQIVYVNDRMFMEVEELEEEGVVLDLRRV